MRVNETWYKRYQLGGTHNNDISGPMKTFLMRPTNNGKVLILWYDYQLCSSVTAAAILVYTLKWITKGLQVGAMQMIKFEMQVHIIKGWEGIGTSAWLYCSTISLSEYWTATRDTDGRDLKCYCHFCYVIVYCNSWWLFAPADKPFLKK